MAMPGVLVLCYHGVSDTWPAPTAVTPELLEKQLSLLKRLGYRGATFTQALTAPPARRTLVVTFDDAPRSVAKLAAPILRALDLPGTVFVPTSFPGNGKPMAWPGQDEWAVSDHVEELTCMSWEELGELMGEGWEVGSHTRSHPHLTHLDDASLEEELRGSLEDCQRALGQPCRTLAYPYSDYDGRVVTAARDAGYLFAATVPREPVAPLPLQWPRVGVYRSDSVRRVAARIWRRSR
jgi:peptidoglycan/xylan/chitin deacetylase (PgdA/CDA1 family)